MKRKNICLTFILALLLLFIWGGVHTKAESVDVDTSGIYESLDDETKEYLGDMDGKPGEEINFSEVFNTLSGIISENLRKPLEAIIVISLIIIITSAVNSFEQLESIPELAGALSITVFLFPIIVSVISDLGNVCDGVSVFLMAAIPVYGTLMIAGGNVTAGTTYGTMTLGIANVISLISQKIIVPALSIILGLSISSSFSHLSVNKIMDSIYKLVKWLMIVAVTLFSGVVSMQSIISGSGDAMGLRTARLIASSAIPIVGSAFGEGVSVVRQSVNVIKSGAGAFGILASFFIFAPLGISTAIWIGVCRIEMIVCELFGTPKIEEFLSCCMSIFKMVLAVLVSLLAVSIVCAAIVIYVGT